MENLIDSVLFDHDRNNDGYIDYVEFAKAQEVESQRVATSQPPPPAHHRQTLWLGLTTRLLSWFQTLETRESLDVTIDAAHSRV